MYCALELIFLVFKKVPFSLMLRIINSIFYQKCMYCITWKYIGRFYRKFFTIFAILDFLIRNFQVFLQILVNSLHWFSVNVIINS